MAQVRIKICGITNAADGLAAARLGADAIGLNFFPASPRYIDLAKAQAILRELPPFLAVAGVFVNEPLSDMVGKGNQLGRLSIIQWHGTSQAPGSSHPFRLISAFSVRDRSDLDRIDSYLDACRQREMVPDALMFDAYDPVQFGGTGHIAPWGLLSDYRPGLPVILAGGLTADNVVEAIRIVQPYAVDVATGVESRPGIKDHGKIARFIERVRSI
ncbi:MAG: phosphoribosylanthranilate isomerase [Gemmataceae bacterium]